MQLTRELVHEFWSKNLAIHEEHLPREQCIKEHVVLSKFSQIYPDVDTEAPFLHTFYNYTFSIELGIRRFKGRNSEGAFYYNASILCPPASNKTVDLSLLNARGLLAEKGNKSQHISDFINMTNKEHHRVSPNWSAQLCRSPGQIKKIYTTSSRPRSHNWL